MIISLTKDCFPLFLLPHNITSNGCVRTTDSHNAGELYTQMQFYSLAETHTDWWS